MPRHPVTSRLLPRMLSAALLLLNGSCLHDPAASRPAPTPPAPIVLLISIDGFRADYITRSGAVRLRALAASGVRAERLVPSFPSKTFPNHYTLITGLYPEHHGIVANTMYDASLGKTFSIPDTSITHDPRWWGGEPLWNTVERQGKKAASYFWVGSDIRIDGRLPTWYRAYDSKVPDETRVRTVLEWLSMPRGTGPAFISLYFSDVDDAGHAFGPESPQVDSAIARVDRMIGAVVDGLTEHGLGNQVDIVVVSDHGMTALAADRTIYLDDYIDLAKVQVIDMSPVGAIVPAAGQELDVYAKLKGAHPHLQVFRKGEVPARLHFSASARITPLVAVADEGWTIATRASVERNGPPKGGAHGYDNLLPSMGALFVASGPDFRQGVVVPPFQNIHVYALLAGLLEVTPAPNDGSRDSTRMLLRPHR